MDHLHYALEYHQLGLNVVPIVPYTKQPAVAWNIFQNDRVTDQWIRKWWSDSPYAGIALVLGPISNVFAIDVDGVEAEQALIEKLGHIPIAPTSNSGSRQPSRYHLLFKHPDLETRAKATPWHPNLEFRGQRGVLIMSPSIHPTGNRYSWEPGRSIFDIPLPDPPQQVMDALKDLAKRRTKLTAQSERATRTSLGPPRIEGISSTTRLFLRGEFADGPGWNDAIFRAACDLSGCGVPHDEAMPLLLAGAQPWNSSERDKAITTIRSAYAEPRISARELAADRLSSDEVINTYEECGITIEHIRHPRRRFLPPTQQGTI